VNDLNLPDPFKIVVYGYKSQSLAPVQGIRVVELDGNHHSRWSCFTEYVGSWILFIDKDCELPTDLIARLTNQLQFLNRKTIYSGKYRSDKNSSTYVRAYNQICNSWLDIGIERGDARILGGCFLLYISPDLFSVENQKAFAQFPKWGAEDFHFSRLMKRVGYQIYELNDFYVFHKPNFGLLKFIRRAFLQGLNRPPNTEPNSHGMISFFRFALTWLSVLKKAEPAVSIVMFLHLIVVFFGQIASKAHVLIQKAWLMNRFQQ